MSLLPRPRLRGGKIFFGSSGIPVEDFPIELLVEFWDCFRSGIPRPYPFFTVLLELVLTPLGLLDTTEAVSVSTNELS